MTGVDDDVAALVALWRDDPDVTLDSAWFSITRYVPHAGDTPTSWHGIALRLQAWKRVQGTRRGAAA